MSVLSARGRWHTAQESEITEPFLMTIVGGSDHWLYASSTGALTAGRVNAESAIFSYETEDRLHRAAGQVGPVTAFRVTTSSGTVLWKPFDPHNHHGRTRTIAKRTLGDGLRFTETHDETGLTFEYEWGLSDELGFVRTCRLSAPSGTSFDVELVDGFRAVLPHGVDSRTQQTASVLVDAYKHSEVVGQNVGVYSLSARIVDRPEPAEALLSTVAYQHGLDSPTIFLDEHQFDAFCAHGTAPVAEQVRLGRRAGYFIHTEVALEGDRPVEWITGCDIGWDAARIVELQGWLDDPTFADRAHASVTENQEDLLRIVARADGLQTTASPIHDDRHATNVMFNCMRGGVIASEELPAADVRDFIEVHNARVAAEHAEVLDALGESFRRDDLVSAARSTGDLDFIRLATEYMPLTFSRRHGDPSRPWNTFNIRVRHADGSRRYYFEGNWRDVFQNWEALLLSFPEYAESAWTMFFNATTADGHNPYRITRDGIDWERPDPEDPWAHIGYWGDHQIIYSLKLLELCEAHHPGLLSERLADRSYVFADVPYRIGSYAAIVDDPHETITFDRDHDRVIDARRERIGADGNLIHDGDRLVRANLAEKLLISALAKLANFVADGGIWMNTQRPEWNDANNALVGYGLSVVTLAYLVRHLRFLADLFDQHQGDIELHQPVAEWLRATSDALRDVDFSGELEPSARRQLLDTLGKAAETYRATVYEHGLGDFESVQMAAINELLATSGAALERSLDHARRPDGMFHGYNLIDLRGDGALVEHLPLMLEGQVAGLSAGMLGPEEVTRIAQELFESPLYRPDQNTFLLYPNQTLPRFLERGIIPSDRVAENPLVRTMAADASVNIVREDAHGIYRFSAGLRNADDLAAALAELGESEEYRALIDQYGESVGELWEDVFVHRAYTGRSGSMYGYEGLGSVYWHMVSKLNLAIQEAYVDAVRHETSREQLQELGAVYYRHRNGLGDGKTFAEYGAFPTDAYSHTPPNGGARQPGMTGQVKEDILTRRGELGVHVREGRLVFSPDLLRASEFLSEPAEWTGYAVDGSERTIALNAGELAFSVCQVPVVYRLVDGDGAEVEVVDDAGGKVSFFEGTIDWEWSQEIFDRTSRVGEIHVRVGRERLL